jgi:hypothetical protein
MKLEAWTFAIITIFIAVVTPIYWVLSEDPTGTTALAVTFGLGVLVSFYLFYTGSRLAGPRPEDRNDGLISDRAGEQGFYSPHSWAPLLVGAALALMTLGLAVGWFIVIIAVPLVAASVVYWVFEYYRGAFQH